MELNNLKKLIFWGSLIIIVILLVTNVKLYSLQKSFDDNCIIQYNISLPCPCSKVSNPYNSLNSSLESMNLTLELVGIQNPYPS